MGVIYKNSKRKINKTDNLDIANIFKTNSKQLQNNTLHYNECLSKTDSEGVRN